MSNAPNRLQMRREPDAAADLKSATGIVEIQLDAIARNWCRLAARVAPAECAAVVKADAYGLGAAHVVPALAAAGCTSFFIATPDEAATVRALVPLARIFALDGLPGNVAEDFAALDVIPVLSTVDDLNRWASLARQRNVRLPAALHIDTGLNRLGLSAGDTRRIAADPRDAGVLAIQLVMSHLASADNPRSPKNRDQLLAFETLTALFRGVPRSLAASDGLLLGPAYYFDLVRPGYALYGGQASQTHPAPVEPAVSVKARILAVQDVLPGETVGYSATWRAARPTRIATVAAGYADGMPRNASAASGQTGGSVIIADQKAPIVGRVSMDLITVDVTDMAPESVMPGAFATLIGDGISLEDAGQSAATIGYEILTRIGPRFARRYHGGGN